MLTNSYVERLYNMIHTTNNLISKANMEQEIVQNANLEWMVPLFVGVLSAFIGTFLGAVLLNYFQKSNVRKYRKSAIKALKILKKYDTKKYGEAKSQFNVDLSISEKRAVLVLLHKMGIPIQIPSSKKFDIKNIEFTDIVIDGKEIKGIIDQVKGGYGDMFIFNDVETYFTSNIRISTVRNIGEKYVKEVLAKSKLVDKTIYYPKNWINLFSVGELQTIVVLHDRLNNESYFQNNGNVSKEAIEKLIREIQIGLWDIYLFWDVDSYHNMQSQINFASVFQSALVNQHQIVQKQNS